MDGGQESTTNLSLYLFVVLSDKRSNEISEFVVDQTIEREGFWSEETADFPRK